MIWNHFRIDGCNDDSRQATVWIDVQGHSVNVFDEAVWDEFTSILAHLEQTGTHFVLFRSAKTKGFFAGANLSRIASIKTDPEIQNFMRKGQDALVQLERSVLNSVALIHGSCLGGGLEFALACRQRWALSGSPVSLAMPEARLGLAPGWGGTFRLPRLLGVVQSLQMMVDGIAIDKTKGLEIGLINRIVGDSELPLNEVTPITESQKERDRNAGLKILCEWRKNREPLTMAQASICNSVESGLMEGEAAAMRMERSQFYELLSNPEVQANLARYRKPPN